MNTICIDSFRYQCYNRWGILFRANVATGEGNGQNKILTLSRETKQN